MDLTEVIWYGDYEETHPASQFVLSSHPLGGHSTGQAACGAALAARLQPLRSRSVLRITGRKGYLRARRQARVFSTQEQTSREEAEPRGGAS